MTDRTAILTKIVDRAETLYRRHGIQDRRETILMDLFAADMHMPLDLASLLAADDANFAHDVLGIRRHMDRTSGSLSDFFVPRFALRNRPARNG